MTLGGIIALLLLLVSLIVFIYVIAKSARTWGVLHTILLCFLFIECWGFMFVSAGVQYRRVSGVARADKAQKDAAQALKRQEDLLWGNFDVTNLNLEAVVPVKGKLQRMTADRGRVWRGITFVQGGANGYQLDLAAGDVAAVDPLAQPDADADAAAGPISSESLPVDLVVYGFAEEVNEENQSIPVFYLGEYSVAQSQDGAVTLQPTLALQQSQLDYISSGAAGSWTLYELLPLDSHEAFAAPGSEPDEDEELFGRMDEETINALFANVPEENGRKQALIDSYQRDGQRASDEDPPESVWYQVNVMKEFELQVDSQDEANATERGYFDFEGRSIDVRLKRGDDGTVKLAPDTKIVLVAEEAQRLIENGTVELVQRVYIRPLVDYQQAFTRLIVRSHEVSEAIALVERETAKLDKSNQLGQEMISFRQGEKLKLASDTANYLKEVAVLEEALKEAQDEQARLKQEINKLYRAVQSRRAKLAQAGS